jgi:hypothetical protein
MSVTKLLSYALDAKSMKHAPSMLLGLLSSALPADDKNASGSGAINLSALVSAALSNPAIAWLACAATAEAIPIQPGPESGPDISNQAAQMSGGPKALKDVIACGSYKHPVHGWKLDVDGKRMDKWCAAFDKMSADGIKVPIYADHTPSAKTHLGYLTALCKGGPECLKKYPELAKLPADKAPLDENRLYAVHQFTNPQTAALAHGVGQVSVLIDKNFQGGNGKQYGEAIRHCAVTPEPVVAGQNGFCAMSRVQHSAPCFVRIKEG